MRRRSGALVAMIVVMLLNVAAASATSSTVPNREVSGPFVGTTFYDFVTNGCNLVHQTLGGTYTAVHSQSGTFHLDLCPEFGANAGVVSAGAFTMIDRRGSMLAGTVTGTYDTTNPTSIVFAFTLHIASGTRAFRHIGGTIGVTGVWEFVGDPSPVSGTLVGSLDS